MQNSMLFFDQKPHLSLEHDIVDKFKLDLNNKILKQLEDQKSDMVVHQFDPNTMNTNNYNCLDMAPEDLFEFLLLILSKSKDECSNIDIDEDSYIVSFDFTGKGFETRIVINCMKDCKGAGTWMGFKKGKGCAVKYQKGLTDFRKRYIQPIFEHYAEKKKMVKWYYQLMRFGYAKFTFNIWYFCCYI